MERITSLKRELVRTNNDAAFQCNFLFNIFFVLWMLSVFIELFHWLSNDFSWFCNIFFYLYNLVTDVCMDGWTDRWIEKWTDWQNNWWTGQWMDETAIYMHRHAKNSDFSIDFAIFTKALQSDRRTDKPTNGHTL